MSLLKILHVFVYTWLFPLGDRTCYPSSLNPGNAAGHPPYRQEVREAVLVCLLFTLLSPETCLETDVGVRSRSQGSELRVSVPS